MAEQIGELGKERLRFCCSSSISNFKKKLKKRLGVQEYRFPRDIFKKTIFFGLYHPIDYVKFILHRGKKKVFWCGSDILQLNWFWEWVIAQLRAIHYCENETEQKVLEKILGRRVLVCPMIFDDPSKYQICYKHSDNPRVFGTYHKGREGDYGVFEHPQVDWFADLSEEEFNEKIKEYQGCIRLNQFDGFGEGLAKSILMGQYQFSYIGYKYMSVGQGDPDVWIQSLKKRMEPNYECEKYWRQKLEESLKEILS